jgi:hypothetical protein
MKIKNLFSQRILMLLCLMLMSFWGWGQRFKHVVLVLVMFFVFSIANATTITIAITNGSNPTCAGASVTYTATPSGGNKTFTYQWNKGGTPISGATNRTFTSSSLVNGDAITCTQTNGQGTNTVVTSSAITLTVNAIPNPPSNGGTQSITYGTSNPALSATASSGLTVDWYDAATSGNKVTTGTATTTIYTPTQTTVGIYTYYAEARNTTTGCVSASLTAVSLIINRATPTATLAVSNSPATYSGSAQSATVSISASSVPGTVTTISTGSSATQTNAGTYEVTASFVPTDSANYNTLTNVSSGNFVISPAALLITANDASKCAGATYNLGTTAFTSSGILFPDTIESVSLTSSGSDSGASSGSYAIVPSAATGGTFSASNYSITYSGGILTVNPTYTAGTASSTPNLCINTALTNIYHSTTIATGIGAATGLPAGVAATFDSNTLTISGTPTTSGTFNYSIPLTGGCGSVNATGTITVSPASAGGTVAGSATVCTGTNSATLTLSGHIGTITRWESSLDNFATAGTCSCSCEVIQRGFPTCNSAYMTT